jgi:hypothetical protein
MNSWNQALRNPPTSPKYGAEGRGIRVGVLGLWQHRGPDLVLHHTAELEGRVGRYTREDGRYRGQHRGIDGIVSRRMPS